MNITPNVVDLSHYDNVTDWDAVKAFGILGVINKATEGTGMTDKTFAIRRAPCVQRSILYGAYHFLRPGNPVDQAGHFLNETVPQDNFLLALDHEDPKVPLSAAKQFMIEVKSHIGRFPILYSGFLIKQQLGQTKDPFWAGIKLWLSHYNQNPSWPPCWDKPWLWQFTGDGVGPVPHNIHGITIGGSGIDINTFCGTNIAQEWAA